MLRKTHYAALLAPATALAICLTGMNTAYGQVDFSNLAIESPESLNPDDVLKVSAYMTAPAAGRPAMLSVTADIAVGWHTYSITQAKGGPVPSRITLVKTEGIKLLGEFKASEAPTVHVYQDIWPNVKVEEHEGKVSWTAPIESDAGVELSKLEITGSLYAQVCAKSCLPPANYKFVAKLKSIPLDATRQQVETIPAAAATYRHQSARVALGGMLAANAVRPGDATTITITAVPDEQWHLYEYAKQASSQGSKPTLIVFTKVPGVSFGTPRVSAPPVVDPSSTALGASLKYHEQPVSWEVPVAVASDASIGNREIHGFVGYETCKGGDNAMCLPPRAAKFSTTLKIASEVGSTKAEALSFSDAKYGEAAALAEKQSSPPMQGHPSIPPAIPRNTQAAPPDGFDESAIAKNVKSDASFGAIVFGAFFGGMLLNLMPCVFPVIGLKILSFVEQSHHNRARLLALNGWYTLGVLIVFLAVATVAVLLRSWIGMDFKYGSQNGVPAVAIGIAALMFIMALSLLGVWEIPIPGFLGSGKAAELTSHEGASGAIAKGAITTLLGASCSGPLVAAPFGFALDRATPVWAVYGTFFLIGLGMSTPYLMLGANPGLLRFLPRPGAWMDTFKQICGFFLLGAMIWVLTWLKFYYVTPTVAFLVGLWAACWWIGRVPLTVSTAKRLSAWGWSIAIAILAGVASFNWFLPSSEERFTQTIDIEFGRRYQETARLRVADVAIKSAADVDGSKLPWRPFSRELLVELTREGKTVMVDFTADWCANCKVLESVVLNTADVKAVVMRNNVVPLVADYTDLPQELTDMLTLLKAGAVPVLAIFPASNPNDPIVFRGGYTQQILIDALEKAGPSRNMTETRTASAR
ncbi:MAG: thioredoxin family protein [Pirellulales bacterium]|nr:thioredoxin family protein [Pirellulales bacterium]